MRPVDKLLAGYLAFLTLVIVAHGGMAERGSWWLLAAHGLFAALLYLFTRLEPSQKTGQVLHDLYPLLLLPALYSELGVMSLGLGLDSTLARDLVVQQWESAMFGGQISYEWIRTAPSVFWSGVLHGAYLVYYPIVILGPLLLVARGFPERGRRVLLALMIAYIACYVVFAVFPVAGPNYAFEHPTGAVREVWSARLVYRLLSGASAFGTAFPSSHVAAAVATTTALWYVWRRLAVTFIVPAVLLVVGTVYCQMHYGVDVVAGMAIGIAAGWVGARSAA